MSTETAAQTSEEKRLAKAAKVAEILAHSQCSEEFFRHFVPGVIFTEGVKYMADAAGAHWLVDVVASYQPGLKRRVSAFTKEEGIPFQVWTLKVDIANSTGVVECREDTDTEVLVRQEIPYTDFPCESITLFAADNGAGVTVMVPKEY